MGAAAAVVATLATVAAVQATLPAAGQVERAATIPLLVDHLLARSEVQAVGPQQVALPLSLLEEGKAASIVLDRHRLLLEVRAIDPIPHQWVAVPGLPNSPLRQHQRHYKQRRPPRPPSISSPQRHRRFKHTPIRVSVIN